MVKVVITVFPMTSSNFEQPFGSLSKNTQSFAFVLSLPFLPVGSLVTYNPTVFHRVPDDAARALNLKRKFPSPSTDAILSLSLEILLLMAAFADALPNGSNKVRKIEHNKKIAKFLNFCFFMIYLHF
ncbi:MAG: hypothetical protein V8Q25_08170 [Roseburia faecis]